MSSSRDWAPDLGLQRGRRRRGAGRSFIYRGRGRRGSEHRAAPRPEDGVEDVAPVRRRNASIKASGLQ